MQPRIYQFEIVRSLAMGVYEAHDTSEGGTVTVYQWTPPIEERVDAKKRLAAIQTSLQDEAGVYVFTSEESLYLSAASSHDATQALARLRSQQLFLVDETVAGPAGTSTPSGSSELEESPEPLDTGPQLPAGAYFGKEKFWSTVSDGLFVAFGCSVCWAAFMVLLESTFLARYDFYFALAGAFSGRIIGCVMRYEAGGRGGPKYQVSSAVIAYLSISMVEPLKILWRWFVHTNLIPPDSEIFPLLFKYGLASPFLVFHRGIWPGIYTVFAALCAVSGAAEATENKVLTEA